MSYDQCSCILFCNKVFYLSCIKTICTAKYTEVTDLKAIFKVCVFCIPDSVET